MSAAAARSSTHAAGQATSKLKEAKRAGWPGHSLADQRILKVGARQVGALEGGACGRGAAGQGAEHRRRECWVQLAWCQGLQRRRRARTPAPFLSNSSATGPQRAPVMTALTNCTPSRSALSNTMRSTTALVRSAPAQAGAAAGARKEAGQAWALHAVHHRAGQVGDCACAQGARGRQGLQWSWQPRPEAAVHSCLRQAHVQPHLPPPRMCPTGPTPPKIKQPGLPATARP